MPSMDDGVYTVGRATSKGALKETFGPVCMSHDGLYLGCVMVPEQPNEEAKESKEDSVTFRFKILSMESHKAVKTMEFTAPVEENHRVVALEFTTGPRFLVSGHCMDRKRGVVGELRVWDLETGNCRHTMSMEQGGPFLIHVSRQTDLVACVACDSIREGGSTVQVWDVESGLLACKLDCVESGALTKENKHDGNVTSVALADDGQTVITGSKDGSVRIWDVEEGEVRTVIGRSKCISTKTLGIYALDVASDSRWLVCGGLMVDDDNCDDSSCQHYLYYMSQSGTQLGFIRSQHEGRVRAVSASDDGRVCVAWRQEGEHWSSRTHRLTKAPGMTGSGSEGALGVDGPVEDEIACSADEVVSVTRVCNGFRTGQYLVAFSTGQELRLVVFSYLPHGALK